ncbi:Holliday junction branch migration protein RuvA [Camelliibacillus cellulosilyticus]|uniref:Holliday junction branch migration complex subunit RuvA n=1 Tax=Camelliibacillus cellulosilyticus TaxID=2174486 RepID=A0ABV9GJN8_9BACL
MIEFIHGKIDAVTSEYIVVENHGIGYLVYCPNPLSFPKEAVMTIYTYHYVREDAMHLYGFKTRDERSLFVHLISVSGIGPKGALAVLAAGEPERVAQAIEEEDDRYLTKFPGIGKKTARQMILDLKGKITVIANHSHRNDEIKPTVSNARAEAEDALRALGYSEREIAKVMPKIEDDNLTADQYVKTALRLMLSD